MPQVRSQPMRHLRPRCVGPEVMDCRCMGAASRACGGSETTS